MMVGVEPLCRVQSKASVTSWFHSQRFWSKSQFILQTGKRYTKYCQNCETLQCTIATLYVLFNTLIFEYNIMQIYLKYLCLKTKVKETEGMYKNLLGVKVVDCCGLSVVGIGSAGVVACCGLSAAVVVWDSSVIVLVVDSRGAVGVTRSVTSFEYVITTLA